MFNEFLKTFGKKYNQVLLTDIRDVVFQGSFFNLYESYNNYLGYATELRKIKDDVGVNLPWTLQLLGQEDTKKIWDNQIVCCGNIFGTVEALISLLDNMLDIIKKRNGFFWGADQPAEAYAIYNNLIEVDKIISSRADEDGSIYTNGLIENNTVTDDYVLNLYGHVPHIIHQYDRHKEMVELVDRRYRLKNLDYNNYFDVKSVLDITNSMLFRGNFISALDKLTCLTDSINDSEFKNEWTRVIRLADNLKKYKFDSMSTEILGHVIIRLLIKVAKESNQVIQYDNIVKMWKVYSFMRSEFDSIDKYFEIMLRNLIIQIINSAKQQNQMNLVSEWTKKLNQMN